MRVSLKWLKELVEINLQPQELGDKLTMAGIAVETVESLAKGLDFVVVGCINALEKHPDADKLLVCQLNIGGDTRQIVTGASNVFVGAKVPVALEGANLPNGLTIKAAKLRGVPSSGMLCSTAELNLDPQDWSDESREGILILPEDAPVGAGFAAYLGLDEYVLELELYPNRADCLGMINVAREVSAITGTKLNLPLWANGVEPKLPSKELGTKVSIQDDTLCNRYTAMIIEDVVVAESPEWMKKRLEAAGMRPINNIVDITNYVMLEMGQPLHAFDFAKLKGNEIIVRRAKPGEKILTLDNIARNLEESMLVIADCEEPVCIAGVMGGLNSEVTSTTKTILLEAAQFNGLSVRRTSKNLGLRSESSLRFEKGVNTANILAVQGRVAELVKQLGAGKAVGPIIDVYPSPQPEVSLTLKTSKVNEVLGLDLSDELIEATLAKLKFNQSWEKPGLLKIEIPSYRADLQQDVDLIEEVARLHGFDKIPTTLPKGSTTLGKRTDEQNLRLKTRITMSELGFSEVQNYSFTGVKMMDKLGLGNDHPWLEQIRLMNPLRDELSLMRTTLVPGLLETASKNASRRNLDLAVYEQGFVYNPVNSEMTELPHEVYKLAGLTTGSMQKAWNQPQMALDFYFVKGALERLFTVLGVGNYSFVQTDNITFLHPGRTANIVVRGKTVGFIGEVHPDVMEEFELSSRTYIFEIDAQALFSAASSKMKFSSIPRYPAVTRDMSLLVGEDVPAERVLKSIKKVGGSLLREARLFDVYQGTQVPDGKKSLAFSLVYQSSEKTLTDDEVVNLHETIKKSLDREFGAEIRK